MKLFEYQHSFGDHSNVQRFVPRQSSSVFIFPTHLATSALNTRDDHDDDYNDDETAYRISNHSAVNPINIGVP